MLKSSQQLFVFLNGNTVFQKIWLKVSDWCTFYLTRSDGGLVRCLHWLLQHTGSGEQLGLHISISGVQCIFLCLSGQSNWVRSRFWWLLPLYNRLVNFSDMSSVFFFHDYRMLQDFHGWCCEIMRSGDGWCKHHKPNLVSSILIISDIEFDSPLVIASAITIWLLYDFVFHKPDTTDIPVIYGDIRNISTIWYPASTLCSPTSIRVHFVPIFLMRSI